MDKKATESAEMPTPRHVGWTVIPDKSVVVSTVELLAITANPDFDWLGIEPYETMVFGYDVEADDVSSWKDLDSAHYDTREEALAGHDVMIAKWAAKE